MSPAPYVGGKEETANPLGGFYAFVRAHVMVVNALVLASGTLVGLLDFLAPKVSVLPRVVYSTTAGLVGLMILAAFAPAMVTNLMSGLGYIARREDLIPLWRRPLWQFVVAILSVVTVAGFASVAKASEGGFIAGSFPAARQLQASLGLMSADISATRVGVDAANTKLDTLVGDSQNPRKALVASGYKYDDNGLMHAIKQGDKAALGLFAQAGFKATYEGPMSLLISGTQPWEPDAVAMLPASMFGSGDSCKAGYGLQWELKAPARERVEAFKRLCDTAKVQAFLEALVAADSIKPASDAAAARLRAARIANLAALRS
jgi:hypothetical protein